jgi:Ca2+-binding RTX toxin-like protein
VQGTPANSTTSLVGGPGEDLFWIGTDTAPVLGPAFAYGNTPTDLAFYYDYASPTAHFYTFLTDPDSPMTQRAERDGVAPVLYHNVSQLIAYTSSAGGNAVNVKSVPGQQFLNLPVAHNDVVTLGSEAPGLGGNMSEINGIVGIASYNPDDAVTLVLDDSGNTTTARDVTITAPDEPGGFVGVQGLSSSTVVFRDYANWNVSIRGGALDDRMRMSGTPLASNMSIDGGAGHDVLVGSGGNVLLGGAGRDLLVAGASASSLDGGSDEDILIGGTLLNTSQPNLDAIMAEWVQTGPGNDYNERVQRLRANLLANDKISDNGGSNLLTGGSDALDLFFGSLVTDGQEDEVIVLL